MSKILFFFYDVMKIYVNANREKEWKNWNFSEDLIILKPLFSLLSANKITQLVKPSNLKRIKHENTDCEWQQQRRIKEWIE